MARGKPIGQGQGHLAITRANSNNFVMDHSMVCIAGAEPVERIGINIKSQNRRVKDGSVIGSDPHKWCVVCVSNRTRRRLCWRKGCIFGTGLNLSGRRKIHTSRRKDDFSSEESVAVRTAPPDPALDNLSEKLMPIRSDVARSLLSSSTYQTLSPLVIRPSRNGKVTVPAEASISPERTSETSCAAPTLDQVVARTNRPAKTRLLRAIAAPFSEVVCI